MKNKDNNIVMLPTEKESILYIDDDGKLNISSNPELPDGINSNQHLYILSDDEIKEDDWCVVKWGINISGEDLFEVAKCTKIGSGGIHYFDEMSMCWGKHELSAKKIIATTDEDLGCEVNNKVLVGFLPLPQPSKQFIEKYIEEYNKGNKNMKTTDGVHLSHCNQGEYEGSCKYGDENCPAMVDPTQDRINGLIKQKDLHKYHEIVEKIKKDLIDEGFDKMDICEYLEYHLSQLIFKD